MIVPCTIPDKLIVFVTFYYNPNRIKELKYAVSQVPYYANSVELHIVTNEDSVKDLLTFEGVYNTTVSVHVIKDAVNHPYYFGWFHLTLLRDFIKKGNECTHVLHMEDDVLIKPQLIYTLTSMLKAIGNETGSDFIPGTVRVEQAGYSPILSKQKRELGKWYACDQVRHTVLDEVSYLTGPINLLVPLDNPHQGFYFLDRPKISRLIEVGFDIPYYNLNKQLDHGLLRERAVAGLTYDNPPENFIHKTVVWVDKNTLKIPSLFHVPHLTNVSNWIDAANIGEILVDEVIKKSRD